MSEDLIERLKRPGTWARHADDIIASSATEELIRDDAPFEAAAEIERLRAKLAATERVLVTIRSNYETAQGNWNLTLDRAEAAEKRLAEAKQIINAADEIRSAQKSYMADRGNEAKGKAVGAASTAYDNLRAAAEWMEKGDE